MKKKKTSEKKEAKQRASTRQLIGEDRSGNWEIEHPDSYRQLSLFDDFHFQLPPQAEDLRMSATGQL